MVYVNDALRDYLAIRNHAYVLRDYLGLRLAIKHAGRHALFHRKLSGWRGITWVRCGQDCAAIGAATTLLALIGRWSGCLFYLRRHRDRLSDAVVVDTDEVLLVCSNNYVQEIKAVAQQLERRGADEASASPTAHRPWGTYTILEERAGFKVKRIVVNAGAALSLQLHRHRSEHWVVVAGIAQVTNGEVSCQLQVGQSTYVPQQTRHRLANLGPGILEVIEVQTGPYLGEDDIIRFEDLYNRVSP